MLVVASLHMSFFIDEAPWALGIFMLLVVCAIEYFLLMLFGFGMLDFVQLLIIMSLIKVDKVVVLGVFLVGDAVVNGFMIRYILWDELRRGNNWLLRISIMEDLLPDVLWSLLERWPFKGLVMLYKRQVLLVIIVVNVVSEDCLLLIRVVMAVIVLILSDVRVNFWVVALLVASLAHEIILSIVVAVVVSVFAFIARIMSGILLVLLFFLLAGSLFPLLLLHLSVVAVSLLALLDILFSISSIFLFTISLLLILLVLSKFFI